jgi:hypothetical protein
MASQGLPRQAAEAAVALLYRSLDTDTFPSEQVERWFGLKMLKTSRGSSGTEEDHIDVYSHLSGGTERIAIDNVVLGAYISFRRHGLLDKETMVQALLEGRMAEYFEWMLRQTHRGDCISCYTQALYESDPNIIPWQLPPGVSAPVGLRAPFMIEPGTTVLLDGLESERGNQLNKSFGTVVCQDYERYHVKVGGGSSSEAEEVIRIKPSNVFRLNPRITYKSNQ